jgi:cell division protein ZapA (FtsZ GTPase activity inhibitor)
MGTKHIQLLNKSYPVSNTESEAEQQLDDAAQALNQALEACKQQCSITGYDEIISITALNLMAELLVLRQQNQALHKTLRRACKKINKKIKEFS